MASQWLERDIISVDPEHEHLNVQQYKYIEHRVATALASDLLKNHYRIAWANIKKNWLKKKKNWM